MCHLRWVSGGRNYYTPFCKHATPITIIQTPEFAEVAKRFLYFHHYENACVVTAAKYRRLSFLRLYIRTMHFPTADDYLEEGFSIREEAVKTRRKPVSNRRLPEHYSYLNRISPYNT